MATVLMSSAVSPQRRLRFSMRLMLSVVMFISITLAAFHMGRDIGSREGYDKAKTVLSDDRIFSHTYRVDDLLSTAESGESQRLEREIQVSVMPDKWQEEGGIDVSFSVSRTSKEHDEIDAYLAHLRQKRMRRRRDTPHTPPLERDTPHTPPLEWWDKVDHKLE